MGAWFGAQTPTETVATDPAPMPSLGIRSSGWEAPTKPGFVIGVSGTSAPTSFEEMASSESMLSPGWVMPISVAGTTIVISPVAGA